MPKKGSYKDRTGEKYSRLTFIRFLHVNKCGAIWICKCDCGVEKQFAAVNVVHNGTESCGCLSREKKIERIVRWSKQSPEAKGCKGRRRSDGYVFIRSPNHPNKTKEGYVAQHRLVIEKKIGRFLREKEVVHHWDENPSNNSAENLCLFRNQSAHARLHMFARRHEMKIIELKFGL